MDPDIITEAAFPAVDHKAWRELAERALKGAAFEETLVSHTDDGLRIEPIYERAEGRAPLARPAGRTGWQVLQRIDHPDPKMANAQAHEDIEGGATGLALVFAGAPNAFGYGLPPGAETLEQVLDGIALDRIHLRIDTHPNSRRSVDWIVSLLASRRTSPAKLSLSFGIDSAALFGGTGRLRMSIEALRASMPQSLAGFFALEVPSMLLEADGRVYHNAGATEAQELGATLSAAVEHMRMVEDARQPLVYATPHLGFALSVDQDQFLSIAKLRALRQLWARVQEVCSIPPSAAHVHAETSWRMMTVKDPETNILRTTIAAFAAAAGGADSLSIVPHTSAHGLADPFARRVARNAQLILADESHLGVVNDPAAGAGGFEALTDALCEAAWGEFQKIEAEGGILQSLKDGHLQARIAGARKKRAAELAADGRTIIGTTRHPLAEEPTVRTLQATTMPLPEDGTVFCERLAPVRYDEMLGGAA